MESKSKKAVYLFGILLSLGLFTTFILGLLVDPYRIFLSDNTLTKKIRRPYFTEHIPGNGTESYIMKAAGITKLQPRTILFGTSIIDSGFNILGSYHKNSNKPSHTQSYFIAQEQPVYNAGIRGGSIGDIYEYVRHSIKHDKNLKHIIIGLEASHFDHIEFKYKTPLLYSSHMDLKTILERTLSRQAANAAIHSSRLGKIDENIIRAFNILRAKFVSTNSNRKDQLINQAANHNTTPFTFIDNQSNRASELITASNSYATYLASSDNNIAHGFKIIKNTVDLAKKNNIKITFFLNPPSPYTYAFLYKSHSLHKLYKIMHQLATITPFYDFDDIVTFDKNNSEYFPKDALHYSSHVGEKLSPLLANISSDKSSKYKVTTDNLDRVYNKKVLQVKALITNHTSLNRLLNHSKIDLDKMDGSFPVIYSHNYYGYKVFSLFGYYYAYPAGKEKKRLIDLINMKDKDIIKKNSLAAIQKTLEAIAA